MPVMRLTLGAKECYDCAVLKKEHVPKNDTDGLGENWCVLHHPELDDRDALVIDAFIDALLTRRGAHSGQGGESLSHSIHVVKRRMHNRVRRG